MKLKTKMLKFYLEILFTKKTTTDLFCYSLMTILLLKITGEKKYFYTRFFSCSFFEIIFFRKRKIFQQHFLLTQFLSWPSQVLCRLRFISLSQTSLDRLYVASFVHCLAICNTIAVLCCLQTSQPCRAAVSFCAVGTSARHLLQGTSRFSWFPSYLFSIGIS